VKIVNRRDDKIIFNEKDKQYCETMLNTMTTTTTMIKKTGTESVVLEDNPQRLIKKNRHKAAVREDCQVR